VGGDVRSADATDDVTDDVIAEKRDANCCCCDVRLGEAGAAPALVALVAVLAVVVLAVLVVKGFSSSLLLSPASL
jgi:hypothetical protein